MKDIGCKAFFVKAKVFLAIISLQFGYAIMVILLTVCLKGGMNHFMLSMYRHVFATLAIAPIALIFERKTRPKMTRSIFWKLMVLAFLEPVLDQNLYYLGLKYTTATYTSTIVNVLPAISFVMAIIFRLEKVNLRKGASQAKVVGTIVTVSGAMAMTIYRGPILIGLHSAAHQNTATSTTSAAVGSPHHWVLGTIVIICCCIGWSGFFILQSYTLKEYPAELSLTAWICLLGAAEGALVSLAFVRDLKEWSLGWDARLLASVYSGVVCSGAAYYIQGMVNKEKGPVFVTVFNPLCLIITAVLGTIFLHELLYVGSLVGAIMIVSGLYLVVWGKSKDKPIIASIINPSTNNNNKHRNETLPIVNGNATTIATVDATTNSDSGANNNSAEENNKSKDGFSSEISMVKDPEVQEVA